MKAAILVFTAALAFAQDPPPPAPPANPVVMVTATPLAPADPNTPYASPRDAARHRVQVTLAELAANRHLKDGLRGFTQALLEDRTYAVAAYDLGILAAIAEKWDDAAAAFEEASKLDPAGLGKTVAPQLERLRLLAKLEKSADGRRKKAYDEALLALLNQWTALPLKEANEALAELGRIDPRRWEAPALLAQLHGDGAGYQAASKFLEIALANASEPGARRSLEAAHQAAARELLYSSARSAAEAASDQGDYPKSAELYQTAWSGIPARVENGLDAASALLLCDQPQQAAALLARLRDSKNPDVEPLASAMLKELAAIEPAPATSDAAQFFHDPGPRDPVRITAMIPPIDRKPLEIYTRPLPKLLGDAQPVVLLAALAADGPGTGGLPVLPVPNVTGDNPWREATSLPARVENATPRPIQTADLSNGAAGVSTLQVISDPSGARLFIGSATDPLCETPCNARVAAGETQVRLSLAGFNDVQQIVQANSDTVDLAVTFEVMRGNVILETASPASVKVNGTEVPGEGQPVELSLVPGLYRIGADFGAGYRERLLMVKAGARLRLNAAVLR